MSVVQLRRLGVSAIERRANRALITLWLIFWMSIGVGVRLGLGAWHGFFWGLIVGGLLSAIITWLIFARPGARSSRAPTITWGGYQVILTEPDVKKETMIDLSGPHRAMLIRAKAENRMLLRLEQLDENGNCTERFDLLGQSPMVLPLPVAGDAHTLVGFEPAFGGMEILEISRFKIAREGMKGDAEMTSILQFLEAHRENQVWSFEIPCDDGVVLLETDGFRVVRDGAEKLFSFRSEYLIEHMAERYVTKEPDRTRARVLIGFVSDDGPEHSLTFSMIAPETWLEQLPSGWNIPERATRRALSLYDDTPESFIAIRALRRYLEHRAPSHPVLEILRH